MGKKRRDLVVILRLEEAVTLGLLGEVGLGPGGGEEGGGLAGQGQQGGVHLGSVPRLD